MDSSKATLPQQQLEAWFENEKAQNGLFDIKLFVSPNPDVSTSERAADVLKVIKLWRAGTGRAIRSDADFQRPVAA